MQAVDMHHVSLNAQPCVSLGACRNQIAHLKMALEWQKGRYRLIVRKTLVRYHRDERYAVRLASRAFALSESGLTRLATCESHMHRWARNSSSGASGLMQFLPSTWSHTPFASFSPFDPVANALAAAQIIKREGTRQWVCHE